MARLINIPAVGSESYQDPVQNIGELSASGNNVGDVRLVKDTGGLYYWDGSTWAFVVTSGGGGGGVNEYKPEPVITLSSGDVASKSITLSDIPTNVNKTRLSVIGGVDQAYGDDFTVSGSTLSWNGLGLDGVLTTGDKLLVEYN